MAKGASWIYKEENSESFIMINTDVHVDHRAVTHITIWTFSCFNTTLKALQSSRSKSLSNSSQNPFPHLWGMDLFWGSLGKVRCQLYLSLSGGRITLSCVTTYHLKRDIYSTVLGTQLLLNTYLMAHECEIQNCTNEAYI